MTEESAIIGKGKDLIKNSSQARETSRTTGRAWGRTGGNRGRRGVPLLAATASRFERKRGKDVFLRVRNIE